MNARPETVLNIESVEKSYLSQKVIDGISLTFTQGDIAIILGANGAGKSTLMKMIVGISRPDKGKTAFADKSKDFFSKNAAYLGHESMLYQELTVFENIEFMRKLRKVSRNTTEFLKEWQLETFSSKKISELSRGMRYRTALCNSFIHEPLYVFLDEPTSALDQGSLEILSAKIKYTVNKKKGFALVVTHDVERLAHIANRFLVLDQGKIAYDSAAENEDLNTAKSKSINYYHKTNR